MFIDFINTIGRFVDWTIDQLADYYFDWDIYRM